MQCSNVQAPNEFTSSTDAPTPNLTISLSLSNNKLALQWDENRVHNPMRFLEVVTPSSTTRLWPEMYLDSSLARKSTASAMSLGLSVLP